MRIPFCPFPLEKAKKKAKHFLPIGSSLLRLFPKTKLTLEQAEIDVEPEIYISIGVFSGTFMGLLSFGLILTLSIMFAGILQSILISIGVALAIFFVALIYIAKYPRLIVKRRMADLESNLLYGMKHLYVQIRGGVPLFDALISVSKSNYGTLSKVFSKIVKRVNLGTSMREAMFKSSEDNPSLYFRRVIWEINNGLKEGADIGDVLKAAINNLSSEQRIAIREYGSSLNPMTLMYMMIAVIIPSLGITFLIIMSVFSGLEIGESTFWIILSGVALFQFMFLGIIKSKRPNIM